MVALYLLRWPAAGAFGVIYCLRNSELENNQSAINRTTPPRTRRYHGHVESSPSLPINASSLVVQVMSNSSDSSNAIPRPKRTACDRCRAQKLRCPLRADVTQRCTRCVRLGAQCTTSYGSKALGARRGSTGTQPPLLLPAAAPRGNCDPQDTGEQSSQERRPQTTKTLSSIPMQQQTSTATAWVWPKQASSQNESLMLEDIFVSPRLEEFLDSLDGFNYSGILSPDSSFTGNASPEDPGISFNGDLDMDSYIPPNPSVSARGRTTTDEQQQIRENTRTCPNANVDAYYQCNLNLCNITLKLSKQIVKYMSPSSHESAVAFDAGPSSDSDMNERDPGGSGQFGEVLGYTSEFVAILRTYEQAQSPSGADSKSSMSITIVLNILSAYLQILAIYDHLISCLFHQLQHRTSDSSFSGLQTLPGLRLAGFPVNQGDLQTKILLQVILHQFELIERLLGLPPEYRVSDRRELVYLGLLDNKYSKDILRDVMTGRGTQTTKDACGSGLVFQKSIRENIERVQQLLNK